MSNAEIDSGILTSKYSKSDSAIGMRPEPEFAFCSNRWLEDIKARRGVGLHTQRNQGKARMRLPVIRN